MAQAVPQNNHSIGKQAVIWDENYLKNERKQRSVLKSQEFCSLFLWLVLFIYALTEMYSHIAEGTVLIV